MDHEAVTLLVGKSYVMLFIRSDRLKFLGNCPPTRPLSQHFALDEK